MDFIHEDRVPVAQIPCPTCFGLGGTYLETRYGRACLRCHGWGYLKPNGTQEAIWLSFPQEQIIYFERKEK